MKKKQQMEMLGWAGAVAIVSAYVLLNLNIIKSSDLAYHLLNLTGALGIIAHSIFKRDYQPVVINVIWFIVACVAIINSLFLF